MESAKDLNRPRNPGSRRGSYPERPSDIHVFRRDSRAH